MIGSQISLRRQKTRIGFVSIINKHHSVCSYIQTSPIAAHYTSKHFKIILGCIKFYIACVQPLLPLKKIGKDLSRFFLRGGAAVHRLSFTVILRFEGFLCSFLRGQPESSSFSHHRHFIIIIITLITIITKIERNRKNRKKENGKIMKFNLSFVYYCY